MVGLTDSLTSGEINSFTVLRWEGDVRFDGIGIEAKLGEADQLTVMAWGLRIGDEGYVIEVSASTELWDELRDPVNAIFQTIAPVE